jgi:hypothetical protein
MKIHSSEDRSRDISAQAILLSHFRAACSGLTTPHAENFLSPAIGLPVIRPVVRRAESVLPHSEHPFLPLTLPNFKQHCCCGDVPELSIVLKRELT